MENSEIRITTKELYLQVQCLDRKVNKMLYGHAVILALILLILGKMFL